eukprot:1071629-Rhodomonas_salina.1
MANLGSRRVLALHVRSVISEPDMGRAAPRPRARPPRDFASPAGDGGNATVSGGGAEEGCGWAVHEPATQHRPARHGRVRHGRLLWPHVAAS